MRETDAEAAVERIVSSADEVIVWSSAGETAPSASEYSVSMTGSGRWFVLLAPSGTLCGVLWTDDRDSLGLLGVENTDPVSYRAGWAAIRAARAIGLSASRAFDAFLAKYRPLTYGQGDLSDLLAAF